MVTKNAFVNGIPIQSDWARLNGQSVAAAASMGLITTYADGSFTRVWRPTTAGMLFLEEISRA